jgi:prepilin peptidase CpaA
MSILLIRIALWGASLTLLAMAAGYDLRFRIIPNRLVVLIAASGLALNALSSPWLLWINLLAALLVLLSFGVLSHFNVLGGGDVKLMAAVTLLVPAQQIGPLLMAIALAGGVLSLLYLASYHTIQRLKVARTNSSHGSRQTIRGNRWLANERARILAGKSVPYAMAIMAGVLIHVTRELFQCLSATSCSL